MKYIIKEVTASFHTVYCPVGKFNRTRQHSKGNLSIKVEGVTASEIRVNKDMLREVLLENPDVVRDVLGLVVKPYVEKPIKKIKTQDVGFSEERT